MRTCTYLIKGLKPKSYSELLDYIDEQKIDWLSLSDMVFSANPKQDQICESLKEYRKEYRIERNARTNISAVIDGAPDIKDDDSFSINEFLEHDLCAVGEGEFTKRIVTQKNDEDYKVNFIEGKLYLNKSVIDNGVISQEDVIENATKEFETLQEHNDIIQEDSLSIHALIHSYNLYKEDIEEGQVDFEKEFNKKVTDRLKNNTILSDRLFIGLKQAFMKSKGSFPNSKAITNLNLKCELKNFDKSIIGHIDYLYVDEYGTLHLYNYKVSSQKPNEWPSAKVAKYKAELSFLKRMLANKGYNVKNIELNIIPIHVQYNDDFTQIMNISVLDSKNYSTSRKGTYGMEYYDKMVAYFLDDNYTPEPINNNHISNAIKDIKKVFPDLGITESGFTKTAKEWIANAPDVDPYNIEPLVIEDVQLPNHGYNLKIRLKDGTVKTIEIKSTKAKHKNKELLDAVKQHIEYLSDNKSYVLTKLKNAIKEGYEKGPKFHAFSNMPELNPIFLKSIFRKYFTLSEEEKYDWKLREDLSSSNVLIFENKNHLLDVISLSAFDLNTTPDFGSSRTSVLGCYRYDVETNVFKGDFGNIELIRTLLLLNQLAPNLQGDFKLGNIQVINAQSRTQRSYSASYLNRSQFREILKVVNTENQDSPIKNNLENCDYVNEVELLNDQFLAIIDPLSDAQREVYINLGFDKLNLQSSQSEQEHALFNIMSNIRNCTSTEFNDEQKVLLLARSGSETREANLARLLLLASTAYQAVRNEQVLHKSTTSTISRISFTATNVPDRNILIVADNLQISNDAIAQEFVEKFYGTKDNPVSINSIFELFFNDVGYSKGLSFIMGNEASQFSNLYKRDESGNNLMIFKNPYDPNEDLSEPERVLLKKVLFIINKVTHKNNFNYVDENSEALKKYIASNPYYFWVPLKKASNATTRLTFKSIRTAMKYMKRLITNSKERFDNVINDMTSEEGELLEKGFDKLQLDNVFSLSMPINNPDLVYNRSTSDIEKSRRQLLKTRGPEFFETNLRNIVIDYLFESIKTEQYNKLLIGTRALLLSLYVTNDYGGNEETVLAEIDHIKDYLKLNVFNRSIMEKASLKVMSYILPVKSAVSRLLIMGNVAGGLRDTTQGLLENTMRALTKYKTDISFKSLSKAYAYVGTHARPNARSINLLSRLCLIYRLSNTDVGRISERAKTDRNGLFNLDNVAYNTLRGPDFFNRMTLFVAKAIEDGCFGAWYLENDELKYDWKKDKRFSALAAGDTNSKDYYEQKSLYFSKIREYNKEHPEQEALSLSLNTNLPTPYSNAEITSIKGVADNILGSYDKSKKGMVEHWAAGAAFGMFTTWFNGIYNNYFGKAGQYSTNQLKLEQDTDPVTGKLLFIDSNGQLTTEPLASDGTKNYIAYKHVPVIVQGIFPTLGVLYTIFKNDGKDELKRYLKANPLERANMRKLISDLLMTLLFLFISTWATGAYKDRKKEAKTKSLISNLMTELSYKSVPRSFDSFLGPFNVVAQLGSKMDPPYYTTSLKLLKDGYSTLFGEKQFAALMTDNFGMVRYFKDTYKAEVAKRGLYEQTDTELNKTNTELNNKK